MAICEALADSEANFTLIEHLVKQQLPDLKDVSRIKENLDFLLYQRAVEPFWHERISMFRLTSTAMHTEWQRSKNGKWIGITPEEAMVAVANGFVCRKFENGTWSYPMEFATNV